MQFRPVFCKRKTRVALEGFEKMSQVYSETSTITFIGIARGTINFNSLKGFFERFKVKFVPSFNFYIKKNRIF